MASGGARDVEIDVTINDKTAPGAASARRNVKSIEDQVKTSSRKIVQDATKASEDFSTSILGGFRLAATKSGPILATAAVSAAPLIGATLSAAVLGAAGGGGIIGGVLLAARDSRVQQAGQLLGERLLSGLEQDASPIIEPLLDAMGQVYDRAEDFDRIFSRAFSSVADDIGPVVDALLDGAVAIGEGFADAVEGSGPVIAEIGIAVREVSESIGEGLTQLSDNGASASMALRDVTTAVVALTDATFDTVDALTQAYAYLRVFTPFFAAFDLLPGVGGEAADAMDELGDGMRFAATETDEATRAIKELNDETFRAAGNAIGAAEAQLRYAEAVKEARDSADGLSKVSAEEEGNLLRQASAANQVVESLVATGAASDQVAAATVNARSEFIGTATSMGYTREQAVALADSYLAIPTTVRTTAVVDANSAAAEIERIKARLGDIPSQINVAIRVTETTASRSAVAAALNKQNFAAAEAGFFQESSRHAELAFMASGFQSAGGGTARTGGPAPLSVESSISVLLDGQPFYDMTATAVSSAQSQVAFWERVGTR